MIVSHRHRFIFLKTTKTAGSALELALAPHCGPQDVLAPLGPDERCYIRDHHLPIPQNHLLPRERWRARDWLRLPLRGAPVLYGTHMRARVARAELGEEVWGSYFKFAFARNPWDRFLSLYHWHYRKARRRRFSPMTPSEFIDHPRTRKLDDNGWGIYTIDGRVAVDRVCRYEDLPGELAFLQQRLGLPEPLVMPKTKHTTRCDRRDHREVLSAADAARIGEIFAAEIALMGYSF
jgi:hypothetical protein